jgi:hypothetical protein
MGVTCTLEIAVYLQYSLSGFNLPGRAVMADAVAHKLQLIKPSFADWKRACDLVNDKWSAVPLNKSGLHLI